ncbi:BgTH12-00631 [Blumeria graminis f. sp. triticale]|uniref:BgTH12-00631 n=1 Tax=Blumeria graminis f. sp. triticale TaxID=1689686 RepID=A0A9W4DRE5_BLUGR|nr:BgTH12-00631 [Blumeria graminis f. sp. triticale]
MEEQVQRLVNKVWATHKISPPDQRLMIAISGIPGAGKTTLAKTVTDRLNTLSQASPLRPLAAYVPMDGYHLTRAQLDALPDPAQAHARRGAAYTFDAASLLSLVVALREPLGASTRTIYAPSFSHALKDPVENEISISPSTQILIFEGNYLTLDKEPWSQISRLFNERWFLEVGFDIARKRLVARHLAAGIASSEKEAWRRIEENDMINALEIVQHRVAIDELIQSLDTAVQEPSH